MFFSLTYTLTKVWQFSPMNTRILSSAFSHFVLESTHFMVYITATRGLLTFAVSFIFHLLEVLSPKVFLHSNPLFRGDVGLIALQHAFVVFLYQLGPPFIFKICLVFKLGFDFVFHRYLPLVNGLSRGFFGKTAVNVVWVRKKARLFSLVFLIG